jgi:hypothetical protein
MKETFPKALAFVLEWEGGYSLDPADPGGETNFGISKKAYPDLDIKYLTKEIASGIYYHDYWRPSGCEDLTWPYDLVVFDTAVNMGVRRALDLFKISLDWKDYLFNRINIYNQIVKPGTLKYFRGWINRVMELKKVAASKEGLGCQRF